MSKLDIIRAWKDEEYREGLSAAERSRLPQNPAGLIELTEPDMADVAGGTFSYPGGFCESYITICTHINYCVATITIAME
jgi:mersacidin/lichenicidin family type 2 lantibiotic